MKEQKLYVCEFCGTQYKEKSKDYVAFENLGEGDYVIVDSEDNVYEYDTEVGEVKNLNSKLFEYILRRFNDVK